jgi:thiosulfate/3-mercaptopyruvate sulfurtransferase
MKVSGFLVDTAWLDAALGAPDLCIFDATVFLHANPDGSGYVPESGRETFAAAHIPGAQFIDLLREFSDPDARVPLMMPAPTRFCELAGGYGVGDDSCVVIYTSGSPMWATRLWWMFRSVGFDNCAVLDGGLVKWQREGRATTDAPARFAAASLTPRPRPKLWANKDDMVRAMNDRAVCTINALSPAVYSGKTNTYGRPGHIPGSHNVFYDTLLDSADGTFLPPALLKARFDAVGAFERPRVICYCGGGISATMDALGLTLAGHPDVAVYDGSMMEWVADPTLPLKLGTDA